MKWWEKQPLTISAVQCNLGDDDNWVLDEYVAKYGFNTEQLLHLLAKDGHMAYYKDAEQSELLDAYLKKSRAHGIREICYYNTHCVTDEIAAQHPDWCQLTADGGRMPAYSAYNMICVNPKGSWHQYFLTELAALCRHDIDGVFLDGPVMRDNGCYCDVCRADFAEKFGHSIDSATRLELQAMRVDSVTEHIREASETIKRINPDILLYHNNSALRADITGSNTRRVEPYVDMLGAEGGFHTAAMGHGLWHVSSKAKYLETLAKGKPTVCFFSGNHSGIAYYLHTPAETTLTYAQSIANGSNVWYGVHFSPSEFIKTPSVLTAKAMNKFVLQNSDVYAASRSCARLALVWSQATANNYASSVEDSDFAAARRSGLKERGDHYMALMSVFDMLARAHIQFDVIDEVSVEEGALSGYEAAILPGVACLSDAGAEAIRAFVAAGGNLLANYDTGMYDPDGGMAAAPKLAEVLGLRGTPKAVRSPSVGNAYAMAVGTHPITDALSFPRIPGCLLNLEWDTLPDTRVLMKVMHPMHSTYANFPADGYYPFLCEHAFGKGRAYYLCGNYAETTTARAIPDYAALVTAFARHTSAPVVESTAPGLYEVTLRRQENRFLLHIVNLTGAMSRPVDAVAPLRDLAFTLHLDGFGTVKGKPRTLRGGVLRNVCVDGAVLMDGGKLAFTLDKLNEYEVVVIE